MLSVDYQPLKRTANNELSAGMRRYEPTVTHLTPAMGTFIHVNGTKALNIDPFRSDSCWRSQCRVSFIKVCLISIPQTGLLCHEVGRPETHSPLASRESLELPWKSEFHTQRTSLTKVPYRNAFFVVSNPSR